MVQLIMRLLLSTFLLVCWTTFGATPFTLYYSFDDLASENVTGLSNKSTAWVIDRDNPSDEGIQYWWDASSTAATNGAPDYEVIRPKSIAAGSPGRWSARMGRGFGGDGGGNVNTTTTNPQGTIPIWGTGNTNLTDTTVAITSGANLVVPSVIAVGTNAVISTNSITLINTGGGMESILWATSSDGGNDYFQIRNGSGAANRFAPSFKGHVESLSSLIGLFITGEVTPALDSGTVPMIRLDGRLDGNLLVTNRPIVQVANFTTVLTTVMPNGNYGIGDTTPAALLTVGSGDLFQVNSSGNIIRVANIVQTFPITNSLEGQVFARTAAGQIYYTNAVSSVNTVVSTKTLADNVATDVFTVSLAALARSGLVVDFEIDVTNGTDTQTFTDTRRVSAVNKAGTVTSALSASSSATATSSADTLNVTVSVSSTATSYTFVVTADTSLGTPTLTMRYTILNFNNATITLL